MKKSKGVISKRLTDLMVQLIEAGYQGEARFSRAASTAAKDVLEGDPVGIELSGFCKETLFLLDDEQRGCLMFIGRYRLEDELTYPAVTLESITEIAWSFYRRYKEKGYELPGAWRELFIRFGMIQLRSEMTTVVVERD